jgi:hypothetical protein
LLQRSGKEIGCVISIRTDKPSSQDASGKIAQDRVVQNHGGEIYPGVYRVTSQTSGSGRFLENIPAADLPVYLVIDDQKRDLTTKIEVVLAYCGGLDTLIAVDTGGDALSSAAGQDQSKATPDQDIRSLRAIGELRGLNTFSAIVACGVDAPEDALQVLSRARADYYDPSPEEKELILLQYQQWEMDGSNPTRFGKTPFAWQMALKAQFGYQVLPLPTLVVLDTVNPWNPFVLVSPSMQGMYFMHLSDHLRSIT